MSTSGAFPDAGTSQSPTEAGQIDAVCDRFEESGPASPARGRAGGGARGEPAGPVS